MCTARACRPGGGHTSSARSPLDVLVFRAHRLSVRSIVRDEVTGVDPGVLAGRYHGTLSILCMIWQRQGSSREVASRI